MMPSRKKKKSQKRKGILPGAKNTNRDAPLNWNREDEPHEAVPLAHARVHLMHVLYCKITTWISGKLAHDLRCEDDTDTISLTIMDDRRVVTAHKDLKIICWDIEQGMEFVAEFLR